jgi:hypothetical protein
VTDIDPKLLHIVNGDRAAGTFLHTFGATDRLLIHRDILSCGPLPRCTTASAWQKVRLDFWRNALAYLRTYDFEPSPIDLLKNAQRLREDDLLPCVWVGTGNSDQLLISFVLHLMTMSAADVAGVHVVQFETHAASGRRVRGTGELSRDEMRAHPTPRKLTAVELAAYRDAWVAVTSPDPMAMSSFASRHGDAPWYVKDAVSKVLRRFPDRASGLNYWDRHLLQGVRTKVLGPRPSSPAPSMR